MKSKGIMASFSNVSLQKSFMIISSKCNGKYSLVYEYSPQFILKCWVCTTPSGLSKAASWILQTQFVDCSRSCLSYPVCPDEFFIVILCGLGKRYCRWISYISWAHNEPSEMHFLINWFTLISSNWHRSEEHTSELQSRQYLVCRLLLEKKKQTYSNIIL